MEETFFSDTTLSDRIDIKMKYENASDLFKQPYFDYLIEFNSDFIDYAEQTAPPQSCNDTPEGNTPLPFAITNITTDKKLELKHTDKGIEEGGIIFGEYPSSCPLACMPSEICWGQYCAPRNGYSTCQWEHNELLYPIDTLSYANLTGAERLFQLKIEFNINEYYNHVGADPLATDKWSVLETYSFGEIVYHEGMLYKAMENISITNLPNEWFDENGDNVNDNPWKILYPWEEGDSAIISMHKQLHDGDNWILDMSILWGCTNPDACNYNPYAIVEGECEYSEEGYGCDGEPLSLLNGLIPEDFNLHSIYPNPFNPTTTISFSIPEFGLTTITVYDITGRELETLANEVLSIGYHSINWNASSYPSGVYLIRMDSGDFTQTQKVVLIK